MSAGDSGERTEEDKPRTGADAGETEAGQQAAHHVALTSAADVLAGSLGEYTRIWLRRVRSGESGILPVIIGLVVIVVYFQLREPAFLSAGNIANLMTQAGFIITFCMAQTFPLLLGEIDLSLGFNAAIGGTITLWMVAVAHPFPTWLAIVAGIAATTAIDAIEGLIVVWLRIPSFVVTLGFYLGLNGVLLWLYEQTGSVGLGGVIQDHNGFINGLVSNNLSPLAGVPYVVPVVLVLLALLSGLLSRTKFGRYMYAIGGNAEAARRAGINLRRMRVLAFAFCGVLAGITGILYASFLGPISNNIQGGQYVLYSVAGAVIGGVSLFGGRGRIAGAVLGGFVVAVIYNGVILLGLGASGQYIWTAAVLLAAVTLDGLSRRGGNAT